MGFFVWYYSSGIAAAFNIYQSLILLTYDQFSISELLKTLFYPWKRDIVRPAEPGLNYLIETFIENLVSRFFGAVMRISTIIAGIVLTAIILVLGLLLYIVILLLPPLSPILAVLSLILLISSQNLGYLIILIASLLSFLTAFMIYRSYGVKSAPPPQPLSQISAKIAAGKIDEVSDYLSYDAAQIYYSSTSWREFIKKILSHPKAVFIFQRVGLHPQIIFEHLPSLSISFDRRAILKVAYQSAVASQGEKIEVGDLLLSLYASHPLLAKFLFDLGITEDDFPNLVYWQRSFFKRLHPPSPLLNPERIRTSGGIARDWAAGYTPTLDRFAFDITRALEHHPNPIQFQAHQDVISQIEQVLARFGEHNVLLLGDPGIGKKTIVLGFANQVLFGQVLRNLSHKRVISLDINTLLSAAKTPSEVENLLVEVLNEAVGAGNIILFIDQVERILGGGESKVGTVDASEVLIPYLRRDDFQLIGATTPSLYHKIIRQNSALDTNFEKIEVLEPDEQQTMVILEEITPQIEAKNRVIITYQAIKETVRLTKRYLPDRKFPEKAIEILDEAAVFSANKLREIYVRPQIIDLIISQKTHIPAGEVQKGEKQRLLNLEKILHQRLIDQNEAIKDVSDALRRARAGVASEKRPIGSFLFLGPTGVGKTETAKALAEAYFGDEKNMIRFDMSEYQEPKTVTRLIGDETTQIPGLLSNAIKDRPFALLLLDEIEKADKNILNLFLQVLDEGSLTDAQGSKIDFKNAIIIATSNAGAVLIREKIKQAVPHPQMKEELLDFVQKQGIFSPEFLNRFDAVVAFRPLSEQELIEVVKILEKRLNKRLEDRKIQIIISPPAQLKLAKLGFDPEFGARHLQRIMQEKIENLVAEKILREELQKGQSLEISEEMLG